MEMSPPPTSNPYQDLPPEKYWKAAVADRPHAGFDDLWHPRFEIGAHTRVATAGSCFAQHISRWLQGRGMNWVDSEPAPPGLGAQERADGGHGVFSFRTGNIYTAALLKQWVFWALGRRAASQECVHDRGAWYDPFRPLVPARGHASEAAVRDDRLHTLDCIRTALLDTDIFIFTLGLTEGWRHRDGDVYPLCPGTVRGRFDAELHRFFNDGFDAVHADLNATFDALREHNPRLRFLLTVSPVPLTATASPEHVLVATTYSKSVLRAVAGALKSERDDVDYFPSYELIASHPMRGERYDANLRTVTPAGVEQVMAHFGQAIGAPPPDAGSAGVATDLFCEEILLQTWLAPPPVQAVSLPRLCLIGDSHMGKLSEQFAALGIHHCGGMIMNGSAWFANRFQPDEEDLFVPLETRSARSRWSQTVGFFDADTSASVGPKTVILNLGLQTHMSVPSFVDWFWRKNGHLQLNEADGIAFFNLVNGAKLDLVRRMATRGARLIAVTDPPTQQVSPRYAPFVPAFSAYELIARRLLTDAGCEVFHARDHFAQAPWPHAYASQQIGADGARDWLHGSDAYYAEVARLLCERYALAT